MFYSLIGALAILINLIINSGVFRNDGQFGFPTRRDYCKFMRSVIAYHATDALWGVIYELRFAPLLYADTVIYFVLMALSVLWWSEFVTRYLETDNPAGLGESRELRPEFAVRHPEGESRTADRKDRFGKVLNCLGKGFFVFQMFALAVNFFIPLLFSVDRGGEYHAGVLRHMAFLLQIGMFLFTSVYAVNISVKSEEALKLRYLTIGLFGVSMVFAIGLQIAFPLLPMYSIGYLLGACALHTFVVECEKSKSMELVRALSSEYVTIYYIDIDADTYQELSSMGDAIDALGIKAEGEDFFNYSRELSQEFVYEEDREAFRHAIVKENVLRAINENGSFAIIYRLMMEGTPTYVQLRAFRIHGDNHHIIMAVSNIDAQIKEKKAAEVIREEQTTYARIAALADNFVCIYVINPVTDHYKLFSVAEVDDAIPVPEEGF